VSDSETAQRIRAELTEWVDRNVAAMAEDLENPREVPVAVDFVLIVATEDAADPDSDTYYHLHTSGCSHYRKIGLLTCATRMLLRDDD